MIRGGGGSVVRDGSQWVGEGQRYGESCSPPHSVSRQLMGVSKRYETVLGRLWLDRLDSHHSCAACPICPLTV